MEAQGDDPRALSYLWATTLNPRFLERAAELGYAPAQAAFSTKCGAAGGVMWAERAVAQGDRRGMYLLAERYMFGAGCEKDAVKGAALRGSLEM
jgi:TPR repeat protein